MPTKNLMKLLPKDSYLAMIRNSVDSRQFRSLFAEVDGQRKDILEDGNLSCAFYVSSLLWHFRLLTEGPHATVAGLIRDLERSGWRKTDTPVPGAVLVWETAVQAGGELHAHSGFALDAQTAVSNSDIARTPQTHHLTFGVREDGSPTRALVSIYVHPNIG